MNASELAREVDLPVPTVHRLVTGKSTRPYPSSLKPIADYFSIDVEQLLGEKPLPNEQPESHQPPATSHIKTIPIIDWSDINNLDKALKKTDNKKVATTSNVSENCFALVMNDYSMDPLFPRKCLLIFEPAKAPFDRSYVLVKLADKEAPIFRQLIKDVDHSYLKPLNPDLSIYQMRLLEDTDKIIASLLESRIHHEQSETDSITEKNHG